MKPTKSKALCRGCGSDFYNHGGQGAKECRSYAEAQVVKRYRLYWWAQPTRPGAFVRMWVMSCLHETGSYTYSKYVPSFAEAVRDQTYDPDDMPPVEDD